MSRRASLEALHRAYRWALAQPLHPVYTSEWVRKAMNYEDIVIARAADGSFLVRGATALRQMRLPLDAGVPQIGTSTGLAGYSSHGSERYLHLDGPQARIVLAPQADSAAFLVDANARIDALVREGGTTRVTLHAHVPLRFTVRHPSGCSVSLGGRRLTPLRSSDGLHHYASDQDGTETLTIGCP